jgi:hypothetical protein
MRGCHVVDNASSGPFVSVKIARVTKALDSHLHSPFSKRGLFQKVLLVVALTGNRQPSYASVVRGVR